ncbi:CoA-transferase family III [Solimonas aquatica]|uniref:CoA-transferase family III n=1 Tax=Solimonas aquatica TaxID=489703 RepID=A0A1H9M2I7_9GAMM|nr:CoA transferase [Solimonas aquatica]SER17910.1 CoA-transferase family III [Solimonas aquatica]
MATAASPLAEADFATRYAQHLLAQLQAGPLHSAAAPPGLQRHPAIAWAQSGLMPLCGEPEGAPQLCPLPLPSCADAALAALAQLSGAAALRGFSGAQLLSERAALMQLTRGGAISAGGACHLLDTREGGIALSLPREEDWELLPAWLQDGQAVDVGDWSALQARLVLQARDELLERAQLLGLACAADVDAASQAVPWLRVLHGAPLHGVNAPRRPPRVLELASLWAGPLCGHLLQLAGAEVVKLESWQRPDGARRGNRDFYDLLNAGKRSVALDFASREGRAQLRALIAHADIVIEGSRPRALRQLGIVAEELLAEQPRLSWIAISAYGRSAEQELRIGYGDDVGVGAGLSAIQAQACGQRMFIGDAIADPLAGLHAALAAWASHASGGGRLIEVSLCGVLRHIVESARLPEAAAWRERYVRWMAAAGTPATPVPRRAPALAAALGADTQSLLRDWAVPC